MFKETCQHSVSKRQIWIVSAMVLWMSLSISVKGSQSVTIGLECKSERCRLRPLLR